MKKQFLATAVSMALALSLNLAHAQEVSLEDLQAAVASKDSQIAAQDESLKKLAAHRNKLFSQLKSTQVDASAERDRLNATINNLAADRNKLFGEYRGLESRNDANTERMQDHINGLYKQRDSLTRQLKAATSERKTAIKTAGESSERLENHIQDLYDKRDALRAQLAEEKQKHADTQASLSTKITAGEQAQEQLIDQLIDLRNSSDERIAAVEEKQKTTSSAELAAAHEKLAAADRAKEELIDQLIDLRNSSDERIAAAEEKQTMAASDALSMSEKKLATAEQGNEQLIDQLIDLRNTSDDHLAKAESRIRTLENVNGSTKRLLSKARTQLDEARAALSERPTASATAATEPSAWANTLHRSMSAKVRDLTGTEVNITGTNTVKVRVGNNGLFESGGIKLTENGKKLLWVIGDALEQHNDTRITIEGHSDNIPVSESSAFANNWELSFARASSALSHLRTNVGLAPERLSVAGASDKFPIATNSTAAGREQNRRVEIVLTPLN